MTPRNSILALSLAGALALAGCAGGGSAGMPSAAELDALTQKIVKNDFHDKGIVKVSQAFADDETMRVKEIGRAHV